MTNTNDTIRGDMDNSKGKIILDVCCGGKMFWLLITLASPIAVWIWICWRFIR